MQFCVKCGGEKTTEECTRVDRRTKSGFVVSNTCNECHTTYKLGWHQKFREEQPEKFKQQWKRKNARLKNINKDRNPYEVGGNKICSVCKYDLPITFFHRQGVASSGLHPACFLCKWNKAHHKKFPNITLTWDQYNKFIEQYDSLCAICKQKEKMERFTRLCIDHDDLTGEIRGLLCVSCNTSIGKFNHSRELLINAIEYLDKTSVA